MVNVWSTYGQRMVNVWSMYARCAAKGWSFHVDELVMQDNTSQMDGAKPWGRRNGCMYDVSSTYLIKRPRRVAAR